jgi:hypothetical protein
MQGLKQGFIRGLDRWGSVIATAGVAVFAAALTQHAAAQLTGIANTKHNLSSTGAAGQNKTSSTDEICVFCHTPHGADTTAPAPLWNKSLASLSGNTYKTYESLGSTTIDGAFATDGVNNTSVGSVSLACLSCHDGTQAMDNIINAPGSGGYSANGGGVNGLAYTWTGARVDANGKLTNATDTLAMLDTDLSNDHPIGIQYCGGGQSTTATTGACVDKDFKAPSTRLIGTKQVWWVDTAGGTAGQREKSDMILYTRTFGTATGPSVECASCHDPHVESGTGTPTAGATFLRVANAGSAVCLSCHVK